MGRQVGLDRPKCVAVGNRGQRGRHVRDQAGAIRVAGLGEVDLVADPRRRALLGVVGLWVVGRGDHQQ